VRSSPGGLRCSGPITHGYYVGMQIRRSKVPLLSMLSAMEYLDWVMVAGAVLLVLGFIGFCMSQNR
jgi:hypothetical protein